jgi:hypothetical protein
MSKGSVLARGYLKTLVGEAVVPGQNQQTRYFSEQFLIEGKMEKIVRSDKVFHFALKKATIAPFLVPCDPFRGQNGKLCPTEQFFPFCPRLGTVTLTFLQYVYIETTLTLHNQWHISLSPLLHTRKINERYCSLS